MAQGRSSDSREAWPRPPADLIDPRGGKEATAGPSGDTDTAGHPRGHGHCRSPWGHDTAGHPGCTGTTGHPGGTDTAGHPGGTDTAAAFGEPLYRIDTGASMSNPGILLLGYELQDRGLPMSTML